MLEFHLISSKFLFQFTAYDFDRFSRHDLIGNVIMRDLFEKSDLYTWTEYTMHIVGSNVSVVMIRFHTVEVRI